MRSVIAFPCAGATLVGTLDGAPGTTAVLIVAGGNEVRAGAHRGMATLATDLARRGVPVLRYDRRGVGDSGGDNGGWESGAADLAAGLAALRRHLPQVRRIVGFGNCDGATTLACFGGAAGIDALVLANPWLGDDPLPPPAAVRARYARALFDPTAWRRLLAGGTVRKLLRGLVRAVARPEAPPLAARVADGVTAVPTTILLAAGDRTAQQFAAALPHVRARRIDTGSHSFADAGDALFAAIMAQVDALRRR